MGTEHNLYECNIYADMPPSKKFYVNYYNKTNEMH